MYTFSHEKEPMPYRIRIPTKSVTLRAVKDLLPIKKGSFRYAYIVVLSFSKYLAMSRYLYLSLGKGRVEIGVACAIFMARQGCRIESLRIDFKNSKIFKLELLSSLCLSLSLNPSLTRFLSIPGLCLFLIFSPILSLSLSLTSRAII